MLATDTTSRMGRVTINDAWQPISTAPEGVVVKTKIDDAAGCRNETDLKRIGRLWFFPDENMYVYYTPTHWSEK